MRFRGHPGLPLSERQGPELQGSGGRVRSGSAVPDPDQGSWLTGGQHETAVRRVRLWLQEGNYPMSFKSKVFAAAVTVTVVGGVGTVRMLAAGAATPSCRNTGIDIFSQPFGDHR